MKVEDTGNKAIVKRKRMDVLEVWTDGACTSNGYKNARAGLGISYTLIEASILDQMTLRI